MNVNRGEKNKMGLEISHDAFHGSYSRFNLFRAAVCTAIGGEWPMFNRIRTADPEPIILPKDFEHNHPGLYAFFMHSDCDGEISPEMCAKIADELQSLLPILRSIPSPDNVVGITQIFILGCRAAALCNQALIFH
jgi:hypothetical protein